MEATAPVGLDEAEGVSLAVPVLRIKDIYFGAFLRTQGYKVADIVRGFHAVFTFTHVPRDLIADYYNGREFVVSPSLLFRMFQDLRRMSRQIDESGGEPQADTIPPLNGAGVPLSVATLRTAFDTQISFSSTVQG